MCKFLKKILGILEKGKDKNYVSPAGEFLNQADQKYGFSAESQQKEILKHRNIFNRQKKVKSQ